MCLCSSGSSWLLVLVQGTHPHPRKKVVTAKIATSTPTCNPRNTHKSTAGCSRQTRPLRPPAMHTIGCAGKERIIQRLTMCSMSTKNCCCWGGCRPNAHLQCAHAHNNLSNMTKKGVAARSTCDQQVRQMLDRARKKPKWGLRTITTLTIRSHMNLHESACQPQPNPNTTVRPQSSYATTTSAGRTSLSPTA